MLEFGKSHAFSFFLSFLLCFYFFLEDKNNNNSKLPHGTLLFCSIVLRWVEVSSLFLCFSFYLSFFVSLIFYSLSLHCVHKTKEAKATQN